METPRSSAPNKHASGTNAERLETRRVAMEAKKTTTTGAHQMTYVGSVWGGGGPETTDVGPHSITICASSAEIGKLGRSRPNFGQFGTEVRVNWAKLGQHCDLLIGNSSFCASSG